MPETTTRPLESAEVITDMPEQGWPETTEAMLTPDGYLVDPSSGEIIRDTVPAELLDEGKLREDQNAVNWIMRRRLKAESELASATAIMSSAHAEIDALRFKALSDLELTPEMIELRAIERQTSSMASKACKKLSFLSTAYDEVLRSFALAALAGSKVRTFATPFGKIAFRKKPVKVAVKSETDAVAYLEKQKATDAIKKSVLLNGIPAEIRGRLISDPALAAKHGFDIVPESDDMDVKAGVSTS
jgi:hypothetical protein